MSRIPDGEYFISPLKVELEQDPGHVEPGFVFVGSPPIKVRPFHCCPRTLRWTQLLNPQWKVTLIEQSTGLYSVAPATGDDFFRSYSLKTHTSYNLAEGDPDSQDVRVSTIGEVRTYLLLDIVLLVSTCSSH
jgi:hypothetical protein